MECLCEKKIVKTISNTSIGCLDSNIITSKYKMVEMKEAYELIKNHFKNNLDSDNIIEIDIFKINSENFTSSEDVYSKINLPPKETSMMDGYAINCELIDINQEIIVIEKLFADNKIVSLNHNHNNGISKNSPNLDEFNYKNSCLYVTTGSMIPDGFNCVIPIEFVQQIEYNKKIKFINDQEILSQILKLGKFIRSIGSDIKQGDLILQKNTKIRITDLGVLASVKITKIKVFKFPKIAIFSTGDELIDIEKTENSHSSNLEIFTGIVDTNRLVLKKLLKNKFPDLEINDYGIVNDDIEKIQETFDKIISDRNDILVTSGGVSMGEKDLVKKFLELKGEIIFGRLNMKPGKPTTFGKYKNLTVCGLPGNPVSCIVCYYLLLNFIIEVSINPNSDWPMYYPFKTVRAKLLHDVVLDIERPEFSRGVLLYDQNEFYVRSTGNQQSSRIKSFDGFNCFIVLPAGSKNKILKKGEFVECIIIKELNNCIEFSQLKKDANSLIKVNYDNIITNNIDDQLNKTRKKYSVATITISDRASKGLYMQDKSTESLKSYFLSKNTLFELKDQKVVPDEKENIIQAYDEYVSKNYNLIVTSGGTGLSPRDITPEITKSYIDKEAYSISNYISIESMKFTKFACLSRPVVGIKNNTLILTLPGNPKAIGENMSIIEDILPHILNQINNAKDSH